MTRQARPRGGWIIGPQRVYDQLESEGWTCRHGVVLGQVLRPWCEPPTPACPHCRRTARDWLTPAEFEALPPARRGDRPGPPATPSLFGRALGSAL